MGAEVGEHVIYNLILGFYGFLALITVVQLLRILWNVKDLQWTTQKLFLFLTFLTCSMRIAFFILVAQRDTNLFMVNPARTPIISVLDTLPVLLFFTTYTLLILFWAEIISVARSQPQAERTKSRWIFGIVNLLAYLGVAALYITLVTISRSHHTIDIIINVFIALIVIAAAFGFLYYGGTLFFILKEFPVNSPERSSKLKEVGYITAVSSVFFGIRAVLQMIGAASKSIDLSLAFVFVYYFLAEIPRGQVRLERQPLINEEKV
ncbi:putative virion binding protein [Planoprotostelium fungivorum]|uniref:Putative virion binding protein n=1 Tax=Planoprotostelium fungivorum TaxID=1890364 RepID=A0A2P6N0I6_9EUKA|nr:putative virion binding protein [Planoprotostelium fungivorum]